MGEAQQLQLSINDNEPNQCQSIPKTMKVGRWVRISLYTLFLLVGQSVATLLGRLYFEKGGKSKWLEAIVQLIGFPILIPLYFILPLQKNSTHQTSLTLANDKPPSSLKTSSIYIGLGLLMAVDTMLYSFGLQYLPVSTYTLICASQLAFNSLFSFFFNGQNFTPYIINSLVLLTISSVLLVFQTTDASSNTSVSHGKYALGFIFTLVASAGYALQLSIIQLVFRKVLTIRGRNFKLILDMSIYQAIVASSAIAIGLFTSGEWRTIKGEMEGYELGKVSYVMTLVWTALLWQVYAIGAVGLLFEVSALFSNVISTMGLPITPVLAVIFLKDKMDGIKGVSMALAVWGFVSYSYQHYLDEFKREKVDGNIVHATSSHDESN